MNVYGIGATPTVADEMSAVVDDAQVIEKTLPARPLRSSAQTVKDRFDQVVEDARDFVNREPMQAVVIAAAASSLLTLLLTARGRSRSEWSRGRSGDDYDYY